MDNIQNMAENSNKLLFETKIIDSNIFRKLQPLRYCIYFVLIFIAFLLVRSTRRYHYPYRSREVYPNLANMLNLNENIIFIVFLALGILAVALHFYSKKYKHLGNLLIMDNEFIFKRNKSIEVFKFKDLSDIKITRGATFHYEYKDDNYLVKFDNWLSFQNNGEFKIEFLIDSVDKNEEFEKMMNEVLKYQYDIKYFSI